jgi:hypothetical protein
MSNQNGWIWPKSKLENRRPKKIYRLDPIRNSAFNVNNGRVDKNSSAYTNARSVSSNYSGYFSYLKLQSKWPKPKYLPDILVPQEAYKFVAVMDEVIRQLSAEAEEPKHSGSRIINY